MPNGKAHSARRREVRRTVPRPGPKWLRYLKQREVAWAILFTVSFTVVASLIAIAIGSHPRSHLAHVVTEPIVARVDFEAKDEDATRQKKNYAQNSQPNVYTNNQQYLQYLQEQFDALIALGDYKEFEEIPQEFRDQLDLTMPGHLDLHRYKDPTQLEERLEEWKSRRDRFLRDFFRLAVLGAEEFETEASGGRITIVHPDPGQDQLAEEVRWPSARYTIKDLKKIREQLDQAAVHFPRSLQKSVVELVFQKLEPTYRFDAVVTEQARKLAFESAPDVWIPYHANDLLIPAGTTLTEPDLARLRAEQRAFAAQQPRTDRWLTRSGQTGLVLLIAVGLWLYIFTYNKRIAQNQMRGLAITALVLLCQFLAVSLCQLQPQLLYVFALFPTLMAAIILAIVYDQRFATAIAAFHTMLVILSLNLPFDFALVMLTGAGTAVAMLREVRTRSALVVIGLWSGLAMGVATFLTSVALRPLHIEGEFWRITINTMSAIFAGLGTGILVQAMLPAIEKAFNISTAMTLRELNDASHPLLQRLAQEAPGTYQHSLRIADMAEAAAETIAADTLACRVGAMYHDIGKINKPAYFIENQGSGLSRHNKLSPGMSLLIIVGHVKDGVEMGREYGLPQALHHFIESHHGTTLIEFFYHAAKKQKEAEAGEVPQEFEFRYPGPKPRTKEAAIMLLCDSIEAMVRSLDEPTPIRIEQMVHAMANKRLMDGQFDQSNLTLQELHKIEQSITKTLCAVYHRRVKYPKDMEELTPDMKEPSAEQPNRPRSVAS